MKKNLLVIVFLFLSLFLLACNNGNKDVKLVLDIDEIDIYVGDSHQIKASLENSDSELIYNVVEGSSLIYLKGNVITALASGVAVVEISVEDYPEIKKNFTVNILEHEANNPMLVVEDSEIKLQSKNAMAEIKAEVKNLDAKIVCEKLGIEHHVIDVSYNFKNKVIDYFVNSYLNGETPNPCSVCNRTVKFQEMINFMKKISADYIATGHYAKIIYNGNKYELHQALFFVLLYNLLYHYVSLIFYHLSVLFHLLYKYYHLH